MHVRTTVVSCLAKTEIQWNKKHYKIKDNVVGTPAYTNRYCYNVAVYYEPNQVEPMNQNEIAIYKTNMKRAKETAIKEERHRNMLQLRKDYNTACQWLELGYVVKHDAEAVLGSKLQRNEESYFSSNYYYYNVKDTEKNETLAEEYKKSFNCDSNYDGQIWW